MWKRLQDTQYYILFTKDFVHEICITDYVNIWTTIFSEKTFLAQLKVCKGSKMFTKVYNNENILKNFYF